MILTASAFTVLSNIANGRPENTNPNIRVILGEYFTRRPKPPEDFDDVFGADVSDESLKIEFLASVNKQLTTYWGKSPNDIEKPSQEDMLFIGLCQRLKAKGLRHNELVKDIGRNIRAYPPYQDTEAA